MTRPRYREDVLRCSEILRLTQAERDELLLAAGFSPESEGAAAAADSTGAAPAAGDPAAGAQAAPTLSRRIRGVLPLGAAAALLLLSVALVAFASVFLLDGDAGHPVAARGESLIVVAPFVNYTGGELGFNVAGRIRDAVEAAVSDAGLDSVRIAEWPDELDGAAAAQGAAEMSGATIVIWGEYDSARVAAHFTAPHARQATFSQQVVDLSSSPARLPTTVNLELTGEVRYVALALLGRLYLEQDDHDRAKQALHRAMEPTPTDDDALASLRILLAQAYMGGDLADFDEAIWLFTQALAADPRSVDALNGRAIAYLERNREWDAQLAVRDLESARDIRPDHAATSLNLAVAYLERRFPVDADLAVSALTDAISVEPDYAAAYVNRAAAYVARGDAGDLDRAFDDVETAMETRPGLTEAYLTLANVYAARGQPGDDRRAIDELSRALELAPGSAEAYYSRGLARSAAGDTAGSLADLRRAQELESRAPHVNAALCLQLSLVGNPESALPYCDTAVGAGPRGAYSEPRSVANALLGRHEEAADDLETFLSWVDSSPREECLSLYSASRTRWLEQLRAGNSPFDAETLGSLRPRPSPPGRDPC